MLVITLDATASDAVACTVLVIVQFVNCCGVVVEFTPVYATTYGVAACVS